MTQEKFLDLLVNKYQFKVTGYNKEKEIDIQINPNKQYWYFLVPYTKRTSRNNIYMGKDGEPFTITTYNYTMKDNLTGEYTHAYIPRSRVLFTTLYQRDLIVLETADNYDKNIATLISQYQILEPKRCPLFFRTNDKTFLNDWKKVIKHGK